jgi:hypothetical protein
MPPISAYKIVTANVDHSSYLPVGQKEMAGIESIKKEEAGFLLLL